MEHNCCFQFSVVQFSATFCYLTMAFWDVMVSSSGVEMPKNEHRHFDPCKWVTLRCLEMSRTIYPVMLHPIKMKILNVNLLDFQTAVLKQVSRPLLPSLVIGLPIMTGILFCVNTVFSPVSIISVPVRCAVCAHNYVNVEHISGLFFNCPSKIRKWYNYILLDCNFYISVIYSIMTSHTTLRSMCIELAGQEELGGLVYLLVW